MMITPSTPIAMVWLAPQAKRAMAGSVAI